MSRSPVYLRVHAYGGLRGRLGVLPEPLRGPPYGMFVSASPIMRRGGASGYSCVYGPRARVLDRLRMWLRGAAGERSDLWPFAHLPSARFMAAHNRLAVSWWLTTDSPSHDRGIRYAGETYRSRTQWARPAAPSDRT